MLRRTPAKQTLRSNGRPPSGPSPVRLSKYLIQTATTPMSAPSTRTRPPRTRWSGYEEVSVVFYCDACPGSELLFCAGTHPILKLMHNLNLNTHSHSAYKHEVPWKIHENMRILRSLFVFTEYSSTSSSSDYSSDSDSSWEDDSVVIHDKISGKAVPAQLNPRANRMDDPKINPNLKVTFL